MKIFYSALSKLAATALFSFLFATTLFATNWNPLPDTGQTQCYDVSGNMITCPSEGEPLYGQDANYQGVESSYTDNENGTVTDNNTELVWQQATGGQMTWQGAINYCNALNLAGPFSWRLPSLTELESIKDYSIDSEYVNPIFQFVSYNGYWSDEEHATDTTKAWDNSIWGNMAIDKSSLSLTRCVAGARTTTGDFIDNGDTITDQATGLTWRKQFEDTNSDGVISSPPDIYSHDEVTWQEALSWCEQLTADGKSDWRLPNIRELNSIINRSRDELYSSTTWSSTTQKTSKDKAWCVDYWNGSSWRYLKTEEKYTRCVRGGNVPADPVTLSVRFGGNGYGTVHLSPSDKDCTDDCTNDYLPGTEVTLTATPDADSTFTGWYGPCEGTGTCTITINEAGSVLARFYRTHDVAVDVYSEADYPSGSGDKNAFLVRLDNLGAETAENIQVDLTYSPNDWNGGKWGWGCGDVPKGITCSNVTLGDNHTQFTISMTAGKYFRLKGRFTPDEDDQQPDAMTVAATATYAGDSNLTNNQDSKSLSSDPGQLMKPDSYALLIGANEDAANKNTIVFTHGWQSDDVEGCDYSDEDDQKACYANPTCMYQLIQCYSNHLWSGVGEGQARFFTIFNQNGNNNPVNQIGGSLNIWQYVWNGAFTHTGSIPTQSGYTKARKNVFVAGEILAKKITNRLGENYTGKIHFIGHSLGTAVTAYAVKKIRHDMQNATVQMTILDHPNRVDRILWMDENDEHKYGFTKNFFVNVLPEINDPKSRNNLLVDNYFSGYEEDSNPTKLGSAGVGTPISGNSVYNHRGVLAPNDSENNFIGLRDPNDVGEDFFAQGPSGSNDHSGVHQWYRWTMWPVKTDHLTGNDFICDGNNNRQADGDWNTRPERSDPLSLYGAEVLDDSLNPCRSGFAFSILQDDPINFPEGNGENYDKSINPAASFHLLGSSKTNYCQLQESPFQVTCSKTSQSYSPLAISNDLAAAPEETLASNAAYMKSMISFDHTINYMSMQYRFNNMSETEFVHILIDGQIVWSITADNAETNTWIDTGKIPLFFEKGEHEFMVVFNGMETDTSTFEIKDLTFYKAPDADNFSWNMFMPAILAGAQQDSEQVPTVTSATGRTWMDRNLGASRVATSMTDEAAYGDLYQWGRLADGHEKRTSGTTTTTSSSDVPGHGQFIICNNPETNWRIPENYNLWQGINGVNNPCPAGFRLPTYDELDTECQSWISNDHAGAFASPLKLILAGSRHFSSGNLGGAGFYWSSSVIEGGAPRGLYMSSDNAVGLSSYYGSAFSIRCIKD